MLRQSRAQGQDPLPLSGRDAVLGPAGPALSGRPDVHRSNIIEDIHASEAQAWMPLSERRRVDGP